MGQLISQDVRGVSNLITNIVGLRWQFIEHVNSENIKQIFNFCDPKVGLN